MKVKLGIIIAIILASTIFLLSFHNGIDLVSSSNKGISTYNSLGALKKSHTELIIPEYIASQTEELQIESIMGQAIQVYNSKVVYKAMPFVNNNADPLGLYEKSEIDNMYKVNSEQNDDEITYFRYRQGYPNYPSCTLINWCTAYMAFGIMTESLISEDEVLEMLKLSREGLTVTSARENDNIDEIEENNEESEELHAEIEINNKYIVELPNFKSEQSIIDGNGASIVYLDSKLAFVIVYDNFEKYENTYSKQEKMELNNEITLYYSKDNTFDTNTSAYNDYELFLETLNDLPNNIKIK